LAALDFMILAMEIFTEVLTVEATPDAAARTARVEGALQTFVRAAIK
jgi:hypothetical protein